MKQVAQLIPFIAPTAGTPCINKYQDSKLIV